MGATEPAASRRRARPAKPESMRLRSQGAALRFGLGLLVLALALGLRVLLLPVEAGVAFITFYPAVFLAYYLLGIGPGFVVMGLGALIGYGVFSPPLWSLDFKPVGSLSTATFVLSSVLLAWVMAKHFKSQAALEQSYHEQQALREQLESSLAAASDLYDNAPCGYYSLDASGAIVKINRRMLSWLEAEADEVLGRPISDFFSAEGRLQFLNNFERFKQRGSVDNLEFDLQGARGALRRVSVSATAICGSDGAFETSRSVMFDITEQVQARRALDEQRQLLDGILAGLPFGVALFNSQQQLSFYNQHFSQLLGYSDAVLKQPGFAFGDMLRINVARGDYSEEEALTVGANFQRQLQTQDTWQVKRQLKSGVWLDIASTPIFRHWTLITYTDVTAQENAKLALENARQTAVSAVAELELTHAKVEHIAYHDALTGLPNRRLFSSRAEQAVASATQGRTQIALCYLDLDGFKPVNDQYGHEAGDQLLTVIGQRLLGCVRAHDTVCRLGGDEFALLLTHFDKEASVHLILNRVLAEIGKPVEVGEGVWASVSVSIGYTLFPEDAPEKGLLMRYADRAMYDAKRQGKNRCVRFNAPEMAARA